MNFEQEKKMAWHVHAANHIPGLNQRRIQTGQDTSTYDPFGQKTKAKTTVEPAHGGSEKYAEPLIISDAQRMVNYLDALQAGYQELHFKAVERLTPFCEPQPCAATGTSEKEVDTRLCQSDYFRILESRIEALQYHLKYMNQLIDSVTEYGSSKLLAG